MTEFGVGAHAVAAGAALAAGAINAIAGGGTLVTFPVLVGLGATNVQANATNTVALSPGYLGGAYAQRGELHGDRARLRRLSIAAGLGGLVGSVLLVTTGEAVFKLVVPYLILLACALLAGQNYLRRWLKIGQREHGMGAEHALVPIGATFAMSIYGGYFGAGLGIMFLAVLGVLFDDPLPRINALRQVLALAVNVVAAILFSFTGDVIWSLAVVMAVAALLGGVIGGRLVGLISPSLLRGIVVVYGVGVAIWYLVK